MLKRMIAAANFGTIPRRSLIDSFPFVTSRCLRLHDLYITYNLYGRGAGRQGEVCRCD